jgi:hypothetical protein
VVLCLDEVEKMKRSSYQGFTLDFRSELRGLADGAAAPLTLVIASRTPLAILFPDSSELTSPLAGLCALVNVPPFTLEEAAALCRQLLAGQGRQLSAEAISRAWEESEGRPYRLQQALKAAYARLLAETAG